MKEQSHKEEMSKALRADFERLRERGVAATLAPGDEPRFEPEPEAPPVDRPPSVAATQSLSEPEAASAVVEPQRPGWLGRLFGL